MPNVVGKSELGLLDGTPEKRVFWSIISDYDLKTGLCELVDNAIDLWMKANRRSSLRIHIDLDVERQLISISDNAGGVQEKDLRFLVAPGGSRSDPNAQMIGIFGVGSKRAGVALGEQVVIKTRYRKERTFEINITKDWLETDTWEVPYYGIPDIDFGTTRIDISYLRKPFSTGDVDEIAVHFGETYQWFIGQGCEIAVNSAEVSSRRFDAWAYPPTFSPRVAAFELNLGGPDGTVVEITAGLIRDRTPETENYGVYFYCNHRLIAKELKTREVGYVTGQAGVPHSDASLCRVIVELNGPAKSMPWNSSKSGINFGHAAFEGMRPTLISLVTYFSSLSRRLRDDWDGKVLRYETGTIDPIAPDETSSSGRLILPRLPRVQKARAEKLKAENKTRIQQQPWTLGLVEAMAAVDIMSRQRLETRNRIALVLLDSTFEIALKEFVVHRTDLFPPQTYTDAYIANLFGRRPNVIAEVAKHVTISQIDLDTARHYYGLRNKLIHERATVGITDSDVDTYRLTVQRVLKLLFNLRF